MSRIAISGSSGLVGSALRARLAAQGHEVVRVLRGNDSDPAALWNPGQGWFRPGALEGCDAVVHLAGASIGDGRWTENRKSALRSSRIEATRLLVDHLGTLERKPAVLITASAVGFYGSRGDEELTEESPAGNDFLAGLTVEWEREAARAATFGIRTVMSRFGVILAKEGGALTRMLLPFKLGAGGRIGNGRQWMAWVSLADAVRAVEYAIATDSIEGPVNVTAPNPVTNAAFTKALGGALHRPTLLPTPTFGLKLLLGGEAAEGLLLTSQRVLPRKLEASGFRFDQPAIDTALAAVLRG
ncbi:MAG: TIGR01777 family oxidoreductase [Dehalococcoidia bacterium]